MAASSSLRSSRRRAADTAKEEKTTSTSRGRISSLFGVVWRNPVRSALVVGLGVAAYSYFGKDKKKDEDKRKKVLVLPFYRMNIVERKDPQSRLAEMLATARSSSEAKIEMSVDELVSLIHEAAEDPNIVALYGVFGNGHGFKTGGWAHLEEIRNALTVFEQSHRRHKDPNIKVPTSPYSASTAIEETTAVPPSPPIRKRLYAYTNSFASVAPGSADLKEYYLASVFSHIHLQRHGQMNLLGLHASSPFLKDFLKKYGIIVDVFKHGPYKNSPNMFTHSNFSKEHRENTETILEGINEYICERIYDARHSTLKHFEYNNFWKVVNMEGSFTADVAQQAGLVDHTPHRDPLEDLVNNNVTPKPVSQHFAKEKIRSRWAHQETDFDHFTAEASVMINEYSRQKRWEKFKDKQQWRLFKRLRLLAETNSNVQEALSMMGYVAPNYNIPKSHFSPTRVKALDEKIVVVKVQGAISETTARKLEKIMKKLRRSDDVKAVVFRVDSPGGGLDACETIYQDMQDLPQKVIVSFGNVSASGGYYISANADRIFASPTTITGSIGVFLLRFDLRGLAKKYGIAFDYASTSEMSGSFDTFHPLTKRMKAKFATYVDGAYDRFTDLVATGRNIHPNDIEGMAQGRVWTGEQAKLMGLVDELGGLDRAIAYCQRNYTETGQATVESWPGEENDLASVRELVAFARQSLGVQHHQQRQYLPWKKDAYPLFASQSDFPFTMTGIMLTADENWAIRCLLEENHVDDILDYYPDSFWQ